jgi:hypothetical protein
VGLELVEEVAPRVGGLAAAGGQRDEHRRAGGGQTPRREHRFGARARVHLEHGGVQEQVVQLEVVQAPSRPAVELLADGLTDP